MKARIALLLLLAGCTDETVVIATVPPEAPDADVDAGHGCSKSSDCSADSFCEFPKCSASTGTCRPYASSFTDDEAPVCGCDHITYVNDSYRRAEGVSLYDQGQCPPDFAQQCDHLCPKKTQTCGRIVYAPDHDRCRSPDSPGNCWVVPGTCAPSPGGRSFVRCLFPGDCEDLCDAVKSGAPYYAYPHSCGPP